MKRGEWSANYLIVTSAFFLLTGLAIVWLGWNIMTVNSASFTRWDWFGDSCLILAGVFQIHEGMRRYIEGVVKK